MAGCVFSTQLIPAQASDVGQALGALHENQSEKNGAVETLAGEKEEYALPDCGYEPKSKAEADHENSGRVSARSAGIQYNVVQHNAAGASESANGTCGNVNWEFSGTTLTITGTGAMPDFTSSQTAPWSSLDVSEVIIGEGITSIGTQSFTNMDSVTSISFPDSLKTIKEAAFYECRGITAVNLPSGVKTVESGAFADCSSLKEFSATEITSLGDYALQGTALTTFEIPKGVTEISTLVFYGNTTIENYTVAQGNTAYTAVDGVIYSKDKSILIMYPCCKSATQFTIPSGVKEIAEYAFYNARNLASVNFSDVIKLGEGAFYYSSLSGELVLSDKITEAGYFAFQNCQKLTSVRFGTGLKESSYSMFEDCTGISSIDFGGLEKLGMRTFLGCDGLLEVTLPNTITEWEGSVFNSCSNLETFTSNGLTEIGYADFAQCYSLKTVKLSKVRKIYRQAFANCPSLKKITLPASTEWVDANAFQADVTVECLNKELVKFGSNGLHYAETITISGTRDYQKAFEVLTIVNEKRKANGLSALTMDSGLLETATIRAGEQAVLFSHTRPDGSSCFTANEDMTAENVAIGQRSASDVMTSWMNSQGHRENILLENAKTIGIGCFYIDGVYTWVQCFGTKETSESAAKKANQSVTQSMDIPRDTFSEAAVGSGIILGGLEEYTYKVIAVTDQTKYDVGQSTQAELLLTNPGFGNQVAFTSSNISWSSGNTSVAKTDTNGNISFVGSGSVTITGKTKYYKAPVKLTVKSTPKLTLQNKTVPYNGKGQKIGTVKIEGKAGSIKYYYYSDSKCTKKLSSYPVKVGTYYVKAKAAADTYCNPAASNVAKLVIKKATPKITLKDKLATYTGKEVKIDKASVNGSTGKVTYKYYTDAKCTKKLSGYPVKAGTYYVKATVAATGTHNSAGSNVAKLVIKKANTLTVSVTSKKYKAAASGKLSGTKTFSIGAKNAKGTVTYSGSSNCNKYITVSSKGKVTVKKGTPKGTYKIAVKAKGTSTYKSKTIKVVIKVY